MSGQGSANKEVAQRRKESLLLAKQMFLANYASQLPLHEESQQAKLASKIADEYAAVKDLPPPQAAKKKAASSAASGAQQQPPKGKGKRKAPSSDNGASMVEVSDVADDDSKMDVVTPALAAKAKAATDQEPAAGLGKVLDKIPKNESKQAQNQLVAYHGQGLAERYGALGSSLILKQKQRKLVMPQWHAPWKLMRVISGHLGWVRCIAIDPANEWFATGAADRTIKIWDLASGTLKLTLTGHISSVMGLVVSNRHPYLFSAGQDKTVRCWDLEHNKVIRSYHGHLSGVYTLAMHPSIDVLFSGGRDSVCRVWDIRTKAQIRVLGGHKHTVASIITQTTDPQVITGSHDCTVRLWDLAAGKTMATLTNHKKSVRAMAMHPIEYTFSSASADNIKVWKLPKGEFLRNHSGHNAIVNAMAVNRDGVQVTGGDNGTMKFWDWKTGHCFQEFKTTVQPGSLESEAGIFDLCYDLTGSRLFAAEADKSIKVYKEDPTATPETHPVNYVPPKRRKRY